MYTIPIAFSLIVTLITLVLAIISISKGKEDHFIKLITLSITAAILTHVLFKLEEILTAIRVLP